MKGHSQPDICRRIIQIRLEMDGPRGKASFAKRLGLSPSTYDYYEGNRVPPAEALVGIAEMAGVDLYWLLTGKSGPSVSSSHPVIQRAAKLLADHPDAAKPLAAFIELLAQSAGFPQKAAVASGQEGVPRRLAEAQGERDEAAYPAAVQPRRQPRDGAIDTTAVEPAKASWIPILGRTAAGVPHFWSSGGEASGITMLADLVRRHAHEPSRQVRSAAAAEGEGPVQEAVAVVTLRQAGEDQPVEFVSARGIKARYADAFALRIDGESMAPEIRHGDIVIVSPTVPAENGRPAVVQLSKQIGVTCKLFRRSGKSVHLIPLNERFSPLVYPAEQVDWALRVLARVHIQGAPLA
jgi:SOS-response transcriptional repressor LexA